MDGRVYIIVLIIALLALMVGIDGLLKGELLRSFAGFFVFVGMVLLLFRLHVYARRFDEKSAEVLARAGTSRSWPFAILSGAFFLVCVAGVATCLFAPFDYLLDWGDRSRGLVAGLASLAGEGGARVLLAALFGFAAWASGKTALTWWRAGQ